MTNNLTSDDVLHETPTVATLRAKRAIAALTFTMLQQGWKCGAPSEEVAMGDGYVVSGLKCIECQSELWYEPFHKSSHYAAYAVCLNCGDTREF